MNQFRVGDVVYLALFKDPTKIDLLRITGIVWSEKDKSIVFYCEILKKGNPKQILVNKLTVKASIMKEAVLAEESIQLLYGYNTST